MVGRSRGRGVQIEWWGWGGSSNRGSSGGDSKWCRFNGAWRNTVDHVLSTQPREPVDDVFTILVQRSPNEECI